MADMAYSFYRAKFERLVDTGAPTKEVDALLDDYNHVKGVVRKLDEVLGDTEEGSDG